MSFFKLFTEATGESRSILMPLGDYVAGIVEATRSKSESGGEYIALQLKCTDANPHFVGSVLFDNINVANANAKAVQIGAETLKQIIINSGLDVPATVVDEDTLFAWAVESLPGVTIGVRVKTERGKDGYDDRSVVAEYKLVADCNMTEYKDPQPKKRALLGIGM